MFAARTDAPVERIAKLFAGETGYATPKIDVRAAVFDARERLLMVRETSDGGRWTLPGGWADTADYASAGDPLCGVAEVPGKSNEEALTEKEKALIGTWYESGNAEQNAWITGTQDKLFLVTHDRHAARLTFTPEGYLYNTDRLFGEVVNDKILWSNGTWWSQRAMKYDQPASAKGEASETH